MTKVEIFCAAYAIVGTLYACVTIMALQRVQVRFNGVAGRFRSTLWAATLCKIVGVAILWPLMVFVSLRVVKTKEESDEVMEQGLDIESIDNEVLLLGLREDGSIRGEAIQQSDSSMHHILFGAWCVALEEQRVAVVFVHGETCEYEVVCVFDMAGNLEEDVSQIQALMDKRRGEDPRKLPLVQMDELLLPPEQEVAAEPSLTHEEAEARIVELEANGYETKRVLLPDGGVRVLKRKREP